jgi:imidazolonepropionase-like amidohydrolase
VLTRQALLGLLLLTANALAQPVAITNVTLIDGTGGPPQPGMTVVVVGERIFAVGREVVLPDKAHVVDGAGKFLIPGLWDMHVHWRDAPYLPLFTANGVTGVRIMWGEPRHLQWRKQIAAKEVTGPRLVVAGTIIDGPRPFWKGSIAAATAQDGREAVRQTVAGGYDFVKVYSSLPREVYFAIADEAKKHNVPFAGHVPTSVSAAEASQAGQKSIEHLTGMLLAVSSHESELRGELRAAARQPRGPEREAAQRRSGLRLLDTYDAGKAAALFAMLKVNGTWQVPTFTVLHLYVSPGQADDARLKFMPLRVRTMWLNDPRFAAAPGETVAHQKNVFQRRLELVGQMHRAGVGILAGSDALNPYCFPGFGLHDELEWLVKAGLSPMASLQAATRNPAEYLGRLHDAGTVEPGKLADLVLLDADPLQDIRNSRRIAAVVASGKLHSREALARMLADIEQMARY